MPICSDLTKEAKLLQTIRLHLLLELLWAPSQLAFSSNTRRGDNASTLFSLLAAWY